MHHNSFPLQYQIYLNRLLYFNIIFHNYGPHRESCSIRAKQCLAQFVHKLLPLHLQVCVGIKSFTVLREIKREIEATQRLSKKKKKKKKIQFSLT